MKIWYRNHSFNRRSLETVAQAESILDEMQARGYVLTLRQLYYQFVRRNWIANAEREYNRLGRLMTNAREAGLISWLAIEDRGRGCASFHVDEDPKSVVTGIEHDLQMDLWARQSAYVEVWVEKQALETVIANACRKLRVPYMACKGYLSASEAWRAGQRFREALDNGKDCALIHLGDHDPSGIHMTEDNRERVNLFGDCDEIEVRRLALNMDQVEHYNPPPNPAKVTDSRAAGYIRRFGHESWELDALDPGVIEDLITSAVEEYIDPHAWNEALETQGERRELLKGIAPNWDAIADLIRNGGGHRN